jgi:salicylate hydroxylase
VDDRHVVVVGGGIGGLTAALLLARAGARVTLFEAQPAARTVGAGMLLQPNGLAVLYGLDLDERLLRRGARIERLRVADPAGVPILDVPVPRFAEGLDHALVLRRCELLAALVDLVRAEPRVERRFDAEVLAATPAGEVTYRTPAGPATLAADLVVGADGAHSRIRKHGRFDARVRRSHRYARGLGPPLPLEGLTEYWTALGIFGVAPVDGGTYFYAATDAPALRAALADGDAAGFRAAWARALPLAGEVLAGVGRVEDLVLTQVIRVDCARWCDGRLVLVGDAAHAMAPNLGQGAGSALSDATVLAWELARPGDLAAALARYEARRRHAVRIVQNLAEQLAWLAALTAPGLRTMRDHAVRLLGRWLVGDLTLRLVEQQDPLWLRLAAADPAETGGG